MVRLGVEGTKYIFFPWVHISRIKARRQFPVRPAEELTTPDAGRFDFNEALIPEDSFEPDASVKEFKVAETTPSLAEEHAIQPSSAIVPDLLGRLRQANLGERRRLELRCADSKAREEAEGGRTLRSHSN
ncbi:uncharacterized protein CCR75_000115 [Bremia lactucae]|uniref:Uncharacterized protein n=1 Tax=Bremia lactucae TaxID=4779 RepID=A0A976IIN3_BRELC|nr:hypothetical protein CCR75_000115 [Bremia lactucae]